MNMQVTTFTTRRDQFIARGKELRERAEQNLKYIDQMSHDEWPFGLGDGSVYPIDEMPSLKKRLGRGRTAKVRAQSTGITSKVESASSSKGKGSNRTKNIENTVRSSMRGRSVGDPGCSADDVLSGIARLDHHNQKGRNIPLNKTSLYVIFQELDEITTKEVKELLAVGDHQARRYVTACELALPLLERSFDAAAEEAHGGERPEDGLDDCPLGVSLEDRLGDWIQTKVCL